MENPLAELNKIGKLATSEFLPFRKLTELNINEEYPIKKLRVINGKYGSNIVAELENCVVNLPKRFQKAIDDDLLEELNKRKLKLKYLGLKDNKYTLVEFVG